MKVFTDVANPEIIQLFLSDKVGVVRTDTLYGILARASSKPAVERVYAIKGRDADKSPIVLISSTDQLFDEPPSNEKKLLERVWPGKVSVIIPAKNAPGWIERGNGSVAYRMPASLALRQLIARVGPLIAPSANPQGYLPAMTIEAAIGYFDDRVDFYVDSGDVTDSTPSRLLRLGDDGEIERLR